MGFEGRSSARQRSAVLAAATVGGSADVLDFLLPLWAGAALGASPSQVGMLVSLELAISLVGRPIAGWLADHRERSRVAASGAFLCGVGCFGYVLASGMEVAFAASAATGAGGALLWVAVRAITAERLPEDDRAFVLLFSRVALFGWLVWIPAMLLLPAWGFRPLFAAFGLMCFFGAIGLLLPGRRSALPFGIPKVRGGGEVRRLWPILVAVGLMSIAEAGSSLLVILHLQITTDLDVFQIALVFLPGGVALTLLPGPLHRLTRRWGRRAVYAAGAGASSVCAAGLSLDPTPPVIAALWVLASASWAALTPVNEAVVAEVSSSERAGHGMSVLGSAALAGGAVGAVSTASLYGETSWAVACLANAAILLAATVLGPLALTRMRRASGL